MSAHMLTVRTESKIDAGDSHEFDAICTEGAVDFKRKMRKLARKAQQLKSGRVTVKIGANRLRRIGANRYIDDEQVTQFA